MALSLTLGAVSAEEAAADAADAVADVAAVEPAADVVAVEEAPAAEGNAAGGSAAADVPVADVAVDVEALNETDDYIIWGIAAINYGPDTAYSTSVKVSGSDNMAIVYSLAEDGSFDAKSGNWNVGDIPAGFASVLYLVTLKVFEGPYYVEALATSLSYDPDLSNNYDIAWVGLDASASEETTTLPEAGNPLAMALLALLAIGIGGIKRRF